MESCRTLPTHTWQVKRRLQVGRSQACPKNGYCAQKYFFVISTAFWRKDIELGTVHPHFCTWKKVMGRLGGWRNRVFPQRVFKYFCCSFEKKCRSLSTCTWKSQLQERTETAWKMCSGFKRYFLPLLSQLRKKILGSKEMWLKIQIVTF